MGMHVFAQWYTVFLTMLCVCAQCQLVKKSIHVSTCSGHYSLINVFGCSVYIWKHVIRYWWKPTAEIWWRQYHVDAQMVLALWCGSTLMRKQKWSCSIMHVKYDPMRNISVAFTGVCMWNYNWSLLYQREAKLLILQYHGENTDR